MCHCFILLSYQGLKFLLDKGFVPGQSTLCVLLHLLIFLHAAQVHAGNVIIEGGPTASIAR